MVRLIFNKRDSKIVELMGFRFSVFEIRGEEISGDFWWIGNMIICHHSLIIIIYIYYNIYR